MKRNILHNTTTYMLALMVLTLCASTALAQETSSAAAQQPDETISVSTSMARVSIAIPNARALQELRWEVSDNGSHQIEFAVDAPSENPLMLTIIVDVGEDRSNKWKYSSVGDQLARLVADLHLKALPRVFVAGPATTRFPFRWPEVWETTYLPDTRSAFGAAINQVEHCSGARRALLVLTNRYEALPTHIFEDTDARLAHTAAFVFVLSVAPQSNVARGTRRVVARGNLEMDADFSTSIDRYTPLFSFAQFVRTANALHVVTYSVGDGEFAHNADHQAEIKVVSARTGEILAHQRRTYRLGQ